MIEPDQQNDMKADPNWYVAEYPAVQAALSSGRVRSAQEHYELHGRNEGRLPGPPVGDGPRTFAHGAYGTNNVGDEAIFDGVRACFPGCIQLYINQPRVKGAVEVYSMLRGRNRFRAGDRLIIGGGGLLYDGEAVRLMIDLGTRVREAGGRLEVRRIGCEAARESYYDVIRELVDIADIFTVRSTISQEIMRSIAGIDCVREDDFALSFPHVPTCSKRPTDPVPTIGIVTTGDYRDDVSVLAAIIREYSGPAAPGGQRVRFVHIPHSKAHTSGRNNDEVVGQLLWSSIGIFLENRELFFSTESFSTDPATVLEKYARLDGVVSARFHGLVFARMLDIPALALRGGTLKNRSFIDDYGTDKLFVSRDDKDMYSTFNEFVARVRAFREDGLVGSAALMNAD